LKKQSEHLLEVAKKAVEMAIEEGEERAMEWVNMQ
jgi:type I restriction enzyme S subunit/type I restriction enzyme M protein